MASTIRGCYRNSPVDGNLYPVEIVVGQSFGEPQVSQQLFIEGLNHFDPQLHL